MTLLTDTQIAMLHRFRVLLARRGSDAQFLDALATIVEALPLTRTEREMQYTLAGAEAAERIRARDFRHPRFGAQTPAQVRAVLADVLIEPTIRNDDVRYFAAAAVLADVLVRFTDNPFNLHLGSPA